jgi:hypothetical protein
VTAHQLQTRIRAVLDELAELERAAYALPQASSVRPTISQAKNAFDQAGFGVYVNRLTDS